MSIIEYLTERSGTPVTEQEIAAATGKDEHLVQVTLREAGDRGWVQHVPGAGWRLA